MPAKSKDIKNKGKKNEKKINKKIDTNELGSTGNYFVDGYEVYEYQTELQGSKKFEEYDKMLRGSAMARATFKAIILPLLSARWIISSDGKGRVDRKQVEFIEQNLFKATASITWEKMLFQIFQCIVQGVYPMEKVWTLSKKWPRWRYGGDWILLKKLAPRHPMTIDKFLFDDDGGIAGITQSAYKNRKSHTTYETVDIPIDKLVLFTFDQEGDNWEGLSLFRTAYGHWRQIKIFYNIAAIGAERMTLGFPVFEYPENFFEMSKPDKDFCTTCFSTIIKNFRAHQHSGAMIPPKAKLHIVKGDFNFIALERLISHHEMKIAQGALASFLKIGEAREGSRALSMDQSDFFLSSLQAVANDICGAINQFLIPEMMANNFKQIDNLPYIKVRNIGARNLEVYARIIQTLISSKVLSPDEEGTLEEELRKVFDLPNMPETQKKRREKYLKYDEEKKDREHEVQNYYFEQFTTQRKMQEDPYQKEMMGNNEYSKFFQPFTPPTNGGMQTGTPTGTSLIPPPPGSNPTSNTGKSSGGDIFTDMFKTEPKQPSRPYFKKESGEYVPRISV